MVSFALVIYVAALVGATFIGVLCAKRISTAVACGAGGGLTAGALLATAGLPALVAVWAAIGMAGAGFALGAFAPKQASR